jgi:hypothetical protein
MGNNTDTWLKLEAFKEFQILKLAFEQAEEPEDKTYLKLALDKFNKEMEEYFLPE